MGEIPFGNRTRYREILTPGEHYPGKKLLYFQLIAADAAEAAPKRLMRELKEMGVPPKEIARLAKGGTGDLVEAILKKAGGTGNSFR